MNTLPGNVSEQGRRDHLRAYFLACVKDNVLSLQDILTPGVLDKVLQTVASDAKVVLADLGRTGGRNALALIGMKLMTLAEGMK